MSTTQTTPLVGLPRFDGWAQVIVAPDQRWHLALAIAGKQAGTLGRELVNSWLELELHNPAELHHHLQEALRTVQAQDAELHLALRWLGEADQQILATYQGAILLKRGQKVGVVCQSGAELRFIQGKNQPEDTLVLLTHQATRFTEELTLKLTQGFDVDSIITSLVSTVHSLPDSSQSALAFVHPAGAGADSVASSLSEPPLSSLLDGDSTYSITDEEAVVPEAEAFAASLAPSRRQLGSEVVHHSVVSETEYPTESGFDDTDEPRVDTAWPHLAPNDQPLELDSLPNTNFGTQFESSARPGFGESVPPRKLSVSTAKLSSQSGAWLKKLGQVLLKAVRVGWSLVQKAQKIRPGTQLATSRESVYVATSQPSPKRIMRWLVPAVVVVLVVGGGIGWRIHSDNQQRQEAQQQIKPLQDQAADAASQVGSNPVSARESVQQVVMELEQLHQAWVGRSAGQKVIAAELSKSQQLLTEISGKAQLDELPIFFDLRFTQPGEGNFIARFAKGGETAAAFVDPDLKQVINLDMATKQFSSSSLPSDLTVVDTAVETNTIWLLGQGEIRRLARAASSSAQTVVSASTSAQQAKLIEAYGQLLYVFNPEQRNIFRFAPADGGSYTQGVTWLRNSQGLDFGAVSSMAIDGDIWLATRQGEIRRFNTGRQAEFAIRGMSEPFSGALFITTHEDFENIYVLEPGQQRVVILSKSGDFLQEFKSSSLASATSLIVDEKNRRLWPVSGSLVYDVKWEAVP